MKRRLLTLHVPLIGLLVLLLAAPAYAQQGSGIPRAAKATTDKKLNPWAGRYIIGRPVLIARDQWGYEILLDGKPYVRQETIPGIAGMHRFRNETDAAKVAALCTAKMKAGLSPFSINADELRALNVL